MLTTYGMSIRVVEPPLMPIKVVQVLGLPPLKQVEAAGSRLQHVLCFGNNLRVAPTK